MIALSLVVSCGLFTSELELPSKVAIQSAREQDSAAWELLETAYEAMQGEPRAGLQAVRTLRDANPDDVRLAMFLQDMEIQYEDRSLVSSRAEAAFAKDETGLHALLLARVVEDPTESYRLLERALSLQPELTQARVYWLAMSARAGDPEVLDELAALLMDQPGSAEAWRLLGELAPLFERPDLARAAAQTEPWSKFEASTRAEYTMAVADLSSGDAEKALLGAHALADDLWQGHLLEAAALAKLGRAQEALEVVESVIADRPNEAAAWFNKGLLLRDYLARGVEAREAFEKFLELNALAGGGDLMRVMQAELWLRQD